MQTNTIFGHHHDGFSTAGLEQIERAIAAAQECVATLQLRRDALANELERITRPAPPVTCPLLPTLVLTEGTVAGEPH